MKTITSEDGTTLAIDISGSGPALVVVAGAFCDRHSKKGLASRLTGSFTVYEYDRRGRGDSGPLGDVPPEKEIDDLAAVVALTGGEPCVFGDSSGGALVIAGAAAGVAFRKIAVYEPPFTSGPSTALAEDLSSFVAAGDRSRAVELFLGLMGVPAPAIQGMKQGPQWSHLEALAHTLPMDVRLCNDGRVPEGQLARISAPLLAIAGSTSPWAVDVVNSIASVAPNAEALTLAGEGHAVSDDALAGALINHFT
ncbi:alpha/beta hydrolase [Paenarthrobacter sp. S56]|uniref:alpha/beta fold hydrolase n=1 Tax=Paenarthrobacter sp. S56 TaxID=3138179 RepID=UPI00321C2CA4